MKQTEFLKLNLPEGTDGVDITKFNENSIAVDTAIKKLNTSAPYELYVSSSGDDTNIGDEQHPLRTLTSAINKTMHYKDVHGECTINLLSEDIELGTTIFNNVNCRIRGHGNSFGITDQELNFYNSNVQFYNVTFRGRVCARKSTMDFTSCVFNPKGGDSTYFLSSIVYLDSCRILGNADGVCATKGSYVSVINTKITNKANAFWITEASQVLLCGYAKENNHTVIMHDCGRLITTDINELDHE